MRAQHLKVLDWRNPANWQSDLLTIETNQIFGEGVETSWPLVDRLHVEPAENLIVYTPLPGPREWQAVLQKVKPKQVYLLFARMPENHFALFLSKILGMLKFKAEQGETCFYEEQLAAVLAERTETVAVALQYLLANDYLLGERKEAFWVLALSEQKNARKDIFLERKLQRLLRESAAFRRYQVQAKLTELQKKIICWSEREFML